MKKKIEIIEVKTKPSRCESALNKINFLLSKFPMKTSEAFQAVLKFGKLAYNKGYTDAKKNKERNPTFFEIE